MSIFSYLDHLPQQPILFVGSQLLHNNKKYGYISTIQSPFPSKNLNHLVAPCRLKQYPFSHGIKCCLFCIFIRTIQGNILKPFHHLKKPKGTFLHLNPENQKEFHSQKDGLKTNGLGNSHPSEMSAYIIDQSQMGSLQSKLKEGYNIKQRPVFKSKLKCGCRPSLAYQLKRSSASSLTYGYLDPKASFQPIRHSSCTNDTQGEEPGFPIQNNCLGYPYTAIGIISCIVSGSVRHSTGALIASNIVLTAAHNLFCLDSHQEVQRVSFHLRTSSGYIQEYNAQKILIPDEFKAGVQENMINTELSRFDYGILLLETHVDVNESGTLGFDFNFAPRQNCQDVFIYGFHKRGGYLQIDGWRINASVGEKMICYTVNGSIDSMGGPIVELNDQNYTIIGIQNGVYRQDHLYQKKAMKLSQEMFDHITQWITHEQEEIDIRDKELGKEGIKQLAKFKWTTLSAINLARNNLGKEGLKYLTRCEWNSLHQLDIGGNDIRKEGVKYLVEIDMKNLKTLNMWGNGIEAEGALLMLNGNWKQLNCINLYNNELDNEGMRYIVKANWSQLENINLGKNNITDAGIRLVVCSNWRNVVSLNIWGNKIKDPKTTSFELKKHLGKLKFLYL